VKKKARNYYGICLVDRITWSGFLPSIGFAGSRFSRNFGELSIALFRFVTPSIQSRARDLALVVDLAILSQVG
jgi:hypothetical protein